MGLLHSMQNAQKYDCMVPHLLVVFMIDFIFVAVSYRIATFISHVPWLGAMILSYYESIPLAELKRFRVDAQTRALRRIKEGSPYRDLFHYLVRYFFSLLPETCDK